MRQPSLPFSRLAPGLSRRLFSAAALALLVSPASCLSWFSDEIASGLARLTMRNLGAVVTMVGRDTQCGFESPAVKAAAVVEGPIGGSGKVTWRVEACALDAGPATGPGTEVGRDCNDRTKNATGIATVTATKVVEGRLTGNPDQPVVPAGPDSVTITLESAEFFKFAVTDSGSDKHLRWGSGGISAVVKPKLARSESKGACAVVTPNVSFSEVRYDNMKGHLFTPDRDFDIEIQTSELSAQNGKNGDSENALSGTLTLWDSEEPVPMEGDTDGLDPDYDAEAFKNSYACTDDMTFPETYSCDLTPKLGLGAARLSVRTFAGLVKAVNADEACGFASPGVLQAAAADGLPGNVGSVTLSISTPCVIQFDVDTSVGTDCMGVTTSVRGRAVVTGTRKVSGWVTGDPELPVVPNSRQPVEISLQADLSNFVVLDSSSDSSLTVQTGRISGNIAPMMALDPTTGACSVATPVAELNDIRWSNAKVRIDSAGSLFDVVIPSGELEAVNGAVSGKENFLQGSVMMGDQPVVVPALEPELNPDYHPAVFAAGFECGGVTLPASDAECSFIAPLAQGVGRLIIRSLALTTRALDDDKHCGFGSIDGLIPADLVQEADGEATASWLVEECQLGADGGNFEIVEDCIGTRYEMNGRATATATKVVKGALALDYPPIQPTGRTAAHIRVHSVSLRNFSIYELAPGADAPEAYLEVIDGTLSGIVRSVTAEAESTPGRFFIRTPVAGYEGARLQNAQVVLHSGNKRFNLWVDDASVDAFNGSFQFRTNEIGGTVSLDGTAVSLPIAGDAQGLRPGYDQETFDSTYACAENIGSQVPPSDYQPSP